MHKAAVSDINTFNVIELEKLVSEDSVDFIKMLDSFIKTTNGVENKKIIKDTIILASEQNNIDIIKYIFSDQIYKSIGQPTVSPYEDVNNHNAFYYAIRSCNVQLLQILINEWPGHYFYDHLNELDEIISKSYDELKLKNVQLQEEMETFIENKLISLRFFSDTSKEDQSPVHNHNTIRGRIDLMLQNISSLCREYTNIEKVDEKFLFIATFIVKNIHILKWQLKSTYDKLPWEEIEFCLVSFILSYTKDQEFNLFCHAVMNKSKILNHLRNFSITLENLKEVIENTCTSKISELPKQNREKVVGQIIKNVPQFEELYKDYEQIRDTYSLIKMDSLIKIIIFANPKEMNYKLVLTRALQGIGEYLKNTLESPKLSNYIGQILKSTLPLNTKEMIIDLRNSISHVHSLSKRTEIEENTDDNFFVGVQNDIKKIGCQVSEILCKNKIKAILTLLKQISNTENIDEMKSICEIFKSTKINENIPDNSNFMEKVELKNLIKEFSDCIMYKTTFETEMFNQINIIITNSENKLKTINANYVTIFRELTAIVSIVNNFNIDQLSVNEIKYMVNEGVIKHFSSVSTDADTKKLKKIIEICAQIFVNLNTRLEGKCLQKERKLIVDILYLIEFRIDDTKWIEDLRNKICKKSTPFHKKEKHLCAKPEKYNDQLLLKLSKLEDILVSNSLTNQLIESIPLYKNNNNLQAIIEMLVLDIMSLLGISKSRLENNMLFLDGYCPLLIGKCLRNYIAHDNAICDILSDPTVAIIITANKLISENITQNEKKIGKLVNNDISKLKDKFHQDLSTVTNQCKMFHALIEGNLDKVNNYIKKGADINARNFKMWNAFHFVSMGGDLKTMEYLLKLNLDVNAKDINGQNALHIAAEYGRETIVDFLISKCALSVNEQDKQNKTPLHFAAYNGHNKTVKILIKNNANINLRDMLQYLPVHYGIQNNHIKIVKFLLVNEEVDILVGDFKLLNIAASEGHLSIINFLLARGANVNQQDDKKLIPLHAAALNGHLEVVKVLYLKGANVNSCDIGGCTPLHYSVENGHIAVSKTLLRYGANPNAVDHMYYNTPLHYASQDGELEIVKILLKNMANVNSVTVEGITPLHFAVMGGHLEIAAVLLEHGANIQAKAKNGDSPLHCGVRKGHMEVAQFLIRHKADVNAKNNVALSVLHIAALEGLENIIDLLIRNGAEVCTHDILGFTPLHTASINGNEAIIDILIKNKAVINAKTNDSITPLHIVASYGHIGAVSLLIENGAEVNLENKNGITPLQLSIIFKHNDIAKLLIKHRTQLNKNIGDSTNLCLAVEAGNTEIIKDLISFNTNSNSEDLSPLEKAIKCNKKEMVEILIANGYNVNAGNPPSLILAIQTGSRDIVEILLKNNANIKDFEGNTPLHLAATRGDKRIATALLRGGAEIDALNFNNVTPLYVAAQDGHKEVIEVLLDQGANVNFKSKEGYTALHWAARNGYDNVIHVLLQNGINFEVQDKENRTSLELAVSYGHLKAVKRLRQYQNNLDFKGYNDYTLLHIASGEANLKMVQYLVDEGADINARNKYGSKPIHIAAREGHTETLKFFLDIGSRINDLGLDNQTLLHYAAIRGNQKMIEYLIEKGISVNVQDDNRATPLHIAVISRNEEAVNVLLKNGAVYSTVDNIDKKYITNDTSHLVSYTDKLFKAVKHNCFSEIENCIKHGAAVNAKADDNGTPLHFAAWKGYEKVVNILLQSKANPNSSGKNGVTPLHYAAKFSHMQIVKSLLSNGAIYNAISESGKTPQDLAVDISIKNILKVIDDLFKNINTNIINDLNKIHDAETVKAIMCAYNRDHQTIVVAAMLKNFSKVQELKEVGQGAVSIEVDKALYFISIDKYEMGLSILKSVFKKRKEILGSDNPGTLDIQYHIAVALFKQGIYQEALTMLKEIHKKQETILGLNYQDTLKTRSTSALVLHYQGKYDAAANIFQEVYKKQKQLLGPSHSDTMVTQFHLALTFDSQGKYEEALIINREVYEKRKSTLGPNDLLTITAHNNTALVLSKQGNVEEALEIYKDVYEKKKNILGINHSDTLRTLHNISLILFGQNKYQEGIKNLKEILKVQEIYLGWNHPETLNTHYAIANILLDQGKYIEALKILQENLNQRMTVIGPSHPYVLQASQLIKDIILKFKLVGRNVPEIIQCLQNKMSIAASEGDIQTIQNLLNQGIGANDKDFDGRTPLFFAVDNGQIGVVNILLKNEADIYHVTIKGNTVLHIASSRGNKEIIEILLQEASHERLCNFINAKTTSGGNTALHVAAKNGFSKIVKCLLTYGAIFNIENNNSMKPINLSTIQNVTDFLMLVENLFEDAKRENDQIINKLQSLEPDEFLAVTNARNIHGKTLQHIAVANKATNIAYRLIDMLRKLS